jgi:hypothetical protein
LILSDDERAALQRTARPAKSTQALALRARIVLACADGLPNKDAAVKMGVEPHTVSRTPASGNIFRHRRDLCGGRVPVSAAVGRLVLPLAAHWGPEDLLRAWQARRLGPGPANSESRRRGTTHGS